jgi:hypothetical protein
LLLRLPGEPSALSSHHGNREQARGEEDRSAGAVAHPRRAARHPPAAGHHFSSLRRDLHRRLRGASQAQRATRSGDPAGAESGLRFTHPVRDHGPSDRAVQARAAGWTVAGPQSPVHEADSAGDGEPGTGYPAIGVFQGGRVGQAPRAPHALGQTPEGGQPTDRILTEAEQLALLEASRRTSGGWFNWRS